MDEFEGDFQALTGEVFAGAGRETENGTE